MPTSIPTSDIRNNWSDIVSRAQYADERFVVERHGSQVAAVVPVEDLETLEGAPDRASTDAPSPARAETTGASASRSTRKNASDRESSSKNLDLSDHLAALRDHVRAEDDPQRELANLIYRLVQESDVEPRRTLLAAAYLCE